MLVIPSAKTELERERSHESHDKNKGDDDRRDKPVPHYIPSIIPAYAVPAMRRAGGGSIIIMSSVAGLRGSAGLAGYCATKGGVRLFAKAVAMECAAAGDGIRVNTVHPGVIDTPIWTKLSGSTGRSVPIDPNEVAKPGYRSAGSDRCKTSQMASYSSPLTLPTT